MKIGVNLLYIKNKISAGIDLYVRDILNGFLEDNRHNQFTLFVNESFYLEAIKIFSGYEIVCVNGSKYFNTICKKLKYGNFIYDCYIQAIPFRRLLKQKNMTLFGILMQILLLNFSVRIIKM